MDDLVVGDESYVDDDLDNLANEEFVALEEDAHIASQLPRRSVDDVLQTGRSNEANIKSDERQITTSKRDHTYASSDYGDFDDQMLDGEVLEAVPPQVVDPAAARTTLASHRPQGLSTQKEQWRVARYGQSESVQLNADGIGREQYICDDHGQREETHSATGYAASQATKGRNPDLQSSINVETLKAQLAQLGEDKEELRNAVQQAKESEYAKIGEIAIVRENASKIERESKAQAQAQQRQHAEELARYRMEIDRVRAELQRITTEKTFLEHDVVEEAKKSKHTLPDDRLDHSRGKQTNNITVPTHEPSTPRRRRNMDLEDGFAENDMQPLTPSKLSLIGRQATPKAGMKRKRQVLDVSPRTNGHEMPSVNEASHQTTEEKDTPLPLPPPPPSLPLPPAINSNATCPSHGKEFLLRLLNYKRFRSSLRIIQVLGQFQWKTDPAGNLASSLYDELSALMLKPRIDNIHSAAALSVVKVWSRCLRDKYHEPVPYLIEYVRFCILVGPLSTCADLTNDLMSLLQETADVVIIPRCQRKSQSQQDKTIDSHECLSLVSDMAHRLAMSQDESRRFWRTIRFDFIMMLLSFIHPLTELILAINLLQTSILPDTFAMIIPPGDGKQDASEARVIDNISRLLIESPRVSQGEQALTPLDLCNLRLTILNLVEAMCATDHASIALCNHRLFLGRMVRLMNDSLSIAYSHPSTFAHLIELVNKTTRLFYFLVTTYPDHVDMQQKLGVIPGGQKKFLIVLTRLAFSDGGVLDKGIADDVVDLARRLLEQRVSPEEAESLSDAMSASLSLA